mgnify:CR=1 FL=1
MYRKSQRTVAVNATSQQQKGKEMEKENKTVQEKKVQRMVNDLIKMAERRGATYYGSWIEDERQYVAGTHFCVCLNKPVELLERDGSYVKKQIYDYMENARIMNEKETALPDELDQMVKTFRSVGKLFLSGSDTGSTKIKGKRKVQIETYLLFPGRQGSCSKCGIFTYA